MQTKNSLSRLLFTLLAATLATTALHAQEQLKINSVFEKYGKQKGSTMVELSGESLKDYRLDIYRSITLPYKKSVPNDIQQSLEADKKQARKIKEVVSNGFILSGYYQLPEKSKNINRYILFKTGNDGTATLIYIEGGSDSEELIKKLFIKNK